MSEGSDFNPTASGSEPSVNPKFSDDSFQTPNVGELGQAAEKAGSSRFW